MTADYISDKDGVFDREWLNKDEEGAEIQGGRFEFNERGLVIIGNPAIDNWRAEYCQLKQRAQGFYRKLGDLLVYGELTYGDLIDQESDESDYEDPVFNAGTLYNAKYVSSRWWPPERRIYFTDEPNLKWSFYQETSPLPPTQQHFIMTMAEQNNWTRDKLRLAVTEYQRINGKREYVPTRPGDLIAEQQRELDQAREELDRVRRESHAALDRIDPTTLPELDNLAQPIIGWLQSQTVNFNAVLIKRSGEVVIKP